MSSIRKLSLLTSLGTTSACPLPDYTVRDGWVQFSVKAWQSTLTYAADSSAHQCYREPALKAKGSGYNRLLSAPVKHGSLYHPI